LKSHHDHYHPKRKWKAPKRTASKGKVLEEVADKERKSIMSKKKQLELAQIGAKNKNKKKGTRKKLTVQELKKRIQEYDNALASGSTADQYKEDTGISKQNIDYYRKRLKTLKKKSKTSKKSRRRR